MKRASESTGPPLVLTGEGLMWVWATILFGAIGWYKSINLVLLLAYLMLAMLMLNGLLAWRHGRRVNAVRERQPPVFAGEMAIVQVTATNVGSMPATVTLEAHVGDTPVTWFVYRLPAGESVSCQDRRVFPQRGRFTTPVRIASAYPFGLLRSERAGLSGPEFIVLPALGIVNPDGLRSWLVTTSGGDSRTRKVLRRVTTDQADVRGIRPYRPGDSIRTVHWRSSARRGQLMVREYDAAPTPELVLVVEPWMPTNPVDRHHDQLEATLSLAATIVYTWGRVYGTTITVAIAGDVDSVRTCPPTDVGVRDVLEPLAGAVGASEAKPLDPSAFDRSLLRAARVLVSTRPNSPYADALTASIGRPFVAVSPADRPQWYQAPSRESGIGSQESGV